METNSYGRRDFLKRLSGAGIATLGASTVLAACGGGESGGQATAEQPAEAPAAAPAAEGCMDTTGLTDQEIAMRTSLQYVDESPEADKDCANCSLYLVAQEGSPCGGCNLLKGPIHPDGYCISWAPQQT